MKRVIIATDEYQKEDIQLILRKNQRIVEDLMEELNKTHPVVFHMYNDIAELISYKGKPIVHPPIWLGKLKIQKGHVVMDLNDIVFPLSPYELGEKPVSKDEAKEWLVSLYNAAADKLEYLKKSADEWEPYVEKFTSELENIFGHPVRNYFCIRIPEEGYHGRSYLLYNDDISIILTDAQGKIIKTPREAAKCVSQKYYD